MNISMFSQAPRFGRNSQSNTVVETRFSALSSDIVDVLESSKTSPEAADNYLYGKIEKMLSGYITAIANSGDDGWTTAAYFRASILSDMINQINTVDLMDRVIELFKKTDGFNSDDEAASMQGILSTLVQRNLKLHDPFRIPGLGA